MGQLAALVTDQTRFFDGGNDIDPPDLAKDPLYEFDRDISSGRERFRMLRRIGYQSRPGDRGPSQRFIVPRNLQTWRTDFASVPAIFGWLVPRSGDHLPAALIHDALVEGPSSYIGPAVTRDEADLVFKEAMADLGTGVVRRWLVWTAVTLATISAREVGRPGTWQRPYYFVVALATLIVVVGLGVVATANLLAILGCGIGITLPTVPWIRSTSFWPAFAGGLSGAIVIPSLLAVLWGRFWRAGVIAGIALAFLLHVTAIIGALTLLYLGLEKIGRLERGRVLLGVLVGAGAIAFVVFLVALLG